MNANAIKPTNNALVLTVPQWDTWTAEQYGRAEIITITRKQPIGWRTMLQPLSQRIFRIHGKLHANQLKQDVSKLLSCLTPTDNIMHFQEWQQDIMHIAQHFCRIMQIDYTWLSLTSDRVCSRFHVDKTDMRLLVTYCGQGTQWRNVHTSKPTIQSIPPHHITLFKGNADHIQHRSPPIRYPSLLLRLDTPHFKTQHHTINPA